MKNHPWFTSDSPALFVGSAAVASGQISERRLRGGGFRRVFRDVYTMAAEPDSHELRCRAAALIAPAGAVITGRSAATLHGVPLARPHDPVQLVIPEAARFQHRSGLDVQRRQIGPDDSRPWTRTPVATPLRLGLDLVLGRGLLRGVADLDAVIRAGLVDADELRSVTRHRRERGIVVARRAIELVDPRAESQPESTVRVLLVLAGLRPVPQYIVRDGRGAFVARVDLGFAAQRLAVEYDGRHHGEAHQLDADRQRLNRLRAAGWRVVFVTAGRLRSDPDSIAREVRASLAQRLSPAASY